jgi:tRNA pseudouridine55 synthase
MDGLLLVDKPAGWTSFDVVAKVRSIIKAETGQKIKIGHTGTLDPAATGLLILVLGKYTKRAAEFSKLDKTYEAELTLGQTSSTGDAEGEIVQKSTHRPGLAEIQNALNKFVGEISQVPPAFSAIKVDGQRAYKLARAGKEVVIESRKVKICSITKVKYEYPILSFTTEVSSGTYIRTLAEDIGQKLSTGAYLSDLRRTEVGKFNVKDAQQLGKLNFPTLESHLIQALPKG